ncbi:MAG: carboxyvinyl-carboxyphosphonate phosphorylmutase [Burkholderiales bacterium]|jgi:2-methylisocitrate lyase-like PEP mutase family enzyme|nr:carboxyvinyl-carboxyphosphonate phosphorylmutase [Burkholderiales bacterium]
MSMGAKMRALLREKKYVYTPGITHALHAMIVEKAGFEYIYMGGYDVSLTLLGLPDVGLITETEMVSNAHHIAGSVKIPVIADADTGYGNAINVVRTVQDFEAAGVAGIHIEDQVTPKRCGHVAGKTLVSLDEAVGKLKAALEARCDPDFIIMARTDAIAATGGGFDEAVRRGKAYARAGCDMLFAEFPTAEIAMPKRFAEAIHEDFPDLPLYFNYSSNLKWHESKVTFEHLAALGYKAMHVSLAGMRATMQATWDYAVDLKARGAQAEIDFEQKLRDHPMGDHYTFAGFPAIKALEKQYLPAEELERKYQGATGL